MQRKPVKLGIEIHARAVILRLPLRYHHLIADKRQTNSYLILNLAISLDA